MGEVLQFRPKQEQSKLTDQERCRDMISSMIANVHLKYDTDHEDLVDHFLDFFEQESATLSFEMRYERALQFGMKHLVEQGQFDDVDLSLLQNLVKQQFSNSKRRKDGATVVQLRAQQ